LIRQERIDPTFKSAHNNPIEERCYNVDNFEESRHRESEEEDDKGCRADLFPTGPAHLRHL
jgi:hypothetical protein